MTHSARQWLQKIMALPFSRLPVNKTIRIMNVCGGHERSITQSGLRDVLPEQIELIPGPGCPVCVCPEHTIQAAIELSQQPRITIASFGDMLHVPVSSSHIDIRSLEAARTAGGRVLAIASPQEVLSIAEGRPTDTVVFFVAGFETTMAPVAAMIAQGVPDNVKFLIAGKRTWPAVSLLLESPDNQLDGLVAPGHVATIMGAREWAFVSNQFSLPVAVAGFTLESLLPAIYSVCTQYFSGRPALMNCYPQLVRSDGNLRAQELLDHVFEIDNVHWRGIGQIISSGYKLRSEYAGLDVFASGLVIEKVSNNSASDLAAGCACDKVVLGQVKPDECRLYGKACVPAKPYGPCMVSEEGACHIWWQNGVRQKMSVPV